MINTSAHIVKFAKPYIKIEAIYRLFYNSVEIIVSKMQLQLVIYINARITQKHKFWKKFKLK